MNRYKSGASPARWCLALTLAALSGAPAHAGWYGKAGIAVGIDGVSNISHDGTIGIPERIFNGVHDGAIKDEQIYDYTPSIMAALGFEYGNWSFETDFSYRYRTDWDVRSSTHSLQTVTNIFSDIESEALLLNVRRRFRAQNSWQWLVGIGLGASHTRIDTQYIERASPAVGLAGWSADTSRSDSNFAWSASIGLQKSLSDRWSLTIDYRYVDYGEIRIGPVPGRSAQLSGNFSSHELRLGVGRWRRSNGERR